MREVQHQLDGMEDKWKVLNYLRQVHKYSRAAGIPGQ